jgi:hypothetical protein
MINTRDSSYDDRIVRLERQVDFLFRRLGIDPDLALTQDDALKNAVDAMAGRSRS